MHPDTISYNQKQTAEDKAICDALATLISKQLPQAVNKVWHGHPVWFIEDNPVVGYSKLKDSVRLLFWSGQSFAEPGLQTEGKFKAADIRYGAVNQINHKDLKRYLRKAAEIQWDYKNIVKRKGTLLRLP